METKTTSGKEVNPVDRRGWIGLNHQLVYTLRIMGADQDETGRVKIFGDAPISFMGMTGENAEVVVSAACECTIDGRRQSVAYLMAQTSYGSAVTVIG
jgi:hypothetical protein